MSRSRFLASIALLMFLGKPLLGGQGAAAPFGPVLPSAKDTWIQIETAHFTLISNAPEKRARDLGSSLERFRAVLAAFHANFRFDSPQPTFVLIFKSDESYVPYKLRVGGKLAENSGMFDPGPDVNYITMTAAWNEDPRPTIYHEFSHQFLGNNLSVIPAWFNEGLAEYYSTFTGDDKHAAVGRPVENHVLWLQMNPPIPLKQLFEQDYNPDFYTEVTRGGTFYAESWALVHYLLANGPQLQEEAGKFLDGIREELPVEQAFQAAFHTSYEALQKDLDTYLARNRFNYTQITFTDKFRVDSHATVKPLSRAEALGRLGDYLLHLQEERYADAEIHFQEALRLEPGNGTALMGLGRLAAERGSFEQATSYYARSAAVRPDDPLLCYQQARALLHRKAREYGSAGSASQISEETAKRVREALNRAVALKPDFAEAYVDIGSIAEAPGQNLGEGIRALEKARQLVPSRLDVSANLFYLYLKSGARDKAQSLYDKVLVPGKNESMIRWARIALEQTDQISTLRTEPESQPDAASRSAVAPDEALFEKRKQSYIELLEKSLQSTDDPESRRKIQAEIDKARDSVNLPAQIDAFNQAVARANRQDLTGAMQILEGLLPQVKDSELKSRTEQMLQSLKARIQKSPK